MHCGYVIFFSGLQIEHERRWDWYRFTLAQKKALVEGWRRDRAELLLRALQTLEEARQQYQQQIAQQDDRRLQQHICSQLRDKVLTPQTSYPAQPVCKAMGAGEVGPYCRIKFISIHFNLHSAV